MRILVLSAALAVLLAGIAAAATLEKLSIEQMSQKSTLIVRGKVSGCAGEARGPVIYTRCKVAVSERWKGQAASTVDFYMPGGTVRGLTQTFGGSPRVGSGEEYVLFLWAGKSGINQVIGLSQGVFDLKVDAKGAATVRREAATEVMLDRNGAQVEDTPVTMGVAELKARVTRALAAGEVK